MKKGHVDYAERQALNVLDEWLDVTGAISIHSSWYYELQSVVEDAVHIGIQIALNGEIKKDSDGNVVKGDQDLADNYDVHVPFKPKRSYNAVIKIVEPEYDEHTAQKISDAHELAKMKAGKVSI